MYTDPSIDNTELPAIADNFGLAEGKTWKGLLDVIQGKECSRKQRDRQLRSLWYAAQNKRSGETGEVYKLIYAARHGEGHHNVAEAKVGSLALF